MAVLSVSAACRTNCDHMTSCRVQSFPWISTDFADPGLNYAESEKAGSQTTLALSRQCSATEPRQPGYHQPSQSSICTAQEVPNDPAAHLAATQYVPSELS